MAWSIKPCFGSVDGSSELSLGDRFLSFASRHSIAWRYPPGSFGDRGAPEFAGFVEPLFDCGARQRHRRHSASDCDRYCVCRRPNRRYRLREVARAWVHIARFVFVCVFLIVCADSVLIGGIPQLAVVLVPLAFVLLALRKRKVS